MNSEQKLHTVEPDKHKSAIIQKSAKHRVRRPGSRKQGGIIIFVLVVISAAIAGGYFLLRPRDRQYILRDYNSAEVRVKTIRDTLELSGTVHAVSQTTIRAPETGILDRLLVAEGDIVASGQIVALLNAENLLESIKAGESQLVQSTRAYKSFMLYHDQHLLNAERQRKDLAEAIDEADENLKEAEELFELGTVTQTDLENSRKSADNALEALNNHDVDEEIALKLHELSKQEHVEGLNVIRNNIADFNERLDDTEITSSIAGRIVWIIDEDTAVGEEIQENDPIMLTADIKSPEIRTEIEEQYIDMITEGQEVLVTISGLQVPGEIDRIGLQAAPPPGGGTPVVQLTINTDSGNAEILPGTSAIVLLILGEIPDANVLPRGPYLTTGNRRYLYKIDEDSAQRIDITVGTITETHVEILTGVSAGDKIITSSYQNFIDYQAVKLGGGR